MRRHLPGLPTRERPLVMGVINTTPDSFSDGGRFAEPEVAIAHGRKLLADGADLIDVGGESTRPGATRPPVAEELARTVDVVAALAAEGAVVSIDTMRAEVADAALVAGATVVNDVSGGLADPEILSVAAGHGAAYVAMHWRAHSDVMQQQAQYQDVVVEVCQELAERLAAARAAGIEQVAIDPGLGFAKTADHNWDLLAALDRLDALGAPILLGASRKSFLGALLSDESGPRPVGEREFAHAAVVALAAERDVWAVRVHDVAATVDVLRAVSRWHGLPFDGNRGAGRVGGDE